MVTTQPSPPAPYGAPPRRSDAIPRIVCAIVGAVALLAVILTVALTDDDLPNGTGVQQGQGGGGGSTNGGGTSGGTGGGTGGSSGGAATTRAVISAAALKNDFPTPPGQTSVDVSASADGTSTYTLKGDLSMIRSFYITRLASLGVTWKPDSTNNGPLDTVASPPKHYGLLALKTDGSGTVFAYLKITA